MLVKDRGKHINEEFIYSDLANALFAHLAICVLKVQLVLLHVLKFKSIQTFKGL